MISCKICLNHVSCIMLTNCKHVGMCNGCCFKYLKEAYFYDKYKKSVVKQSCYPFYKTYVNNLEDFIYTKKCPFCKSYIKGIEYVYIV